MTEPTPPSAPETSAAASVDWAAALARHDRWLRTVVLARVGQSQAVDEVMQEVAVAAAGQRATPADPDKLAPWLYRVAVRQALLFRRKAGRRRKSIEKFAAACRQNGSHGDVASSQYDPLEWLLAQERRQLVQTALAELDRRDAEILLLKYTENWTYRQLAERLGVGESAVESRLHRARLRLRARLAALQPHAARTVASLSST